MKRTPINRGTKGLKRTQMARGAGLHAVKASGEDESVRLNGVNLREPYTAVSADGKPRTFSSVEQRFWKHVRRETGQRGCWVWTASRNPKGYGRIGARHGVMVLAHRVSYVLENGQIPAGLSVLHKCDNPPCVRPDHLFAGTAAENTADMMAKGRNDAPRSLRNGRAKLSDADVAEIRRRSSEGESSRSIAADLGVSKRYVNSIVSGHRRTSPPKTAPKVAVDLAKVRSLGLCEIGLKCFGNEPATETAHRRGKGSGGVGKKNTTSNVASNLLRGCHEDHAHIDNAEVADAERLGLKLRHGKAHPYEMPVYHYRLGWVLLDDAGEHRPAPAAAYGSAVGVLPVIACTERELAEQGGAFAEAMGRFGHINCPGWSTPLEGLFVCGCGSAPFVVETAIRLDEAGGWTSALDYAPEQTPPDLTP